MSELWERALAARIAEQAREPAKPGRRPGPPSRMRREHIKVYLTREELDSLYRVMRRASCERRPEMIRALIRQADEQVYPMPFLNDIELAMLDRLVVRLGARSRGGALRMLVEQAHNETGRVYSIDFFTGGIR